MEPGKKNGARGGVGGATGRTARARPDASHPGHPDQHLAARCNATVGRSRLRVRPMLVQLVLLVRYFLHNLFLSRTFTMIGIGG